MNRASIWSVFRCQSCERIVSVRTRRCPRCKSWTGVPHADPSLDRRLESLRAFGLLSALWAGVAAFAFLLGYGEVAAAVTGAVAALLLFAHALVTWHAAGWVLAEVAWGVTTLVCAFGLRKAGWGLLLTLVPAGLLAIMLCGRRRYLGRLLGEPSGEAHLPVPSVLPEPGPCALCRRRDAEIVAPVYVVSALMFTARYLGRFRSLCSTCARLNALPAVVVTFVLGWWGIPWGLVWTPQAIVDDVVAGGAALDSAEAREVRRREVEDGSEGASGPLAWVGGLFVLPFAILFAVAPLLEVVGR